MDKKIKIYAFTTLTTALSCGYSSKFIWEGVVG